MTVADYRVLVTGSRNWVETQVIWEALYQTNIAAPPYHRITLVHGAARGADTIAATIAKRFGWRVEAHPADWNAHGKAAGPIRNQHMVSLGAEICLAFPIGASPGTRQCIKAATKAGIPVRIYEPSGEQS